MHELTPLGSIFKKPFFLESYPEYPILRFFWSVAKNGLLISVFVQNFSNCDLQTNDTCRITNGTGIFTNSASLFHCTYKDPLRALQD